MVNASCLAIVMALHVGLLLGRVAHASDAASKSVQWYRTAQATPDLIARQPDLQFGADFPSSAIVHINR